MSTLSKQYVIALDFGYPANPNERSTIEDLADHIVTNFSKNAKAMILAQEYVHAELQRRNFPDDQLVEICSGQSTSIGLESGGSYHMLRMANDTLWRLMLDDLSKTPMTDDASPRRNWHPPLTIKLVAHALHAPRIVQQGKLFGMRLIPAKDLPTALYPNAAQWWCRSRRAWYFRESIGYIPLKLSRQL